MKTKLKEAYNHEQNGKLSTKGTHKLKYIALGSLH